MQMMSAGAIGGGVTSALASALGGGDNAQVDAVVWHSVVFGCAMSLSFIISLGVLPGPVFTMLGGKVEVLAGAIRYA